jgi:tetratricopeptide (TPR) repeat protein
MTHLFGLKMFPGARRPRHGGHAWRRTAIALCVAAPFLSAHAAGPKAAAPAASSALPSDPNEPGDNKPPVNNSALDAPLLYQLLLGEFARQEQQPGDAIELYLEAARFKKNDQLFRRAFDIAWENGAADKALEITKTWRQVMPRSTDAVRAQLQLLFALDRVPETSEPLRALLQMTTGPDRAGLISGLPRVALRAKDKAAVAAQFQQLLAPYLDQPETRVATRVAIARLRLGEGKAEAALALGWEASQLEADAIGPALLALDLMSQPGAQPSTGGPEDRTAEALLRRYLAQPKAEPVVRQAYAALLTQQQRIAEAAVQVRLAAQARPEQAMLWLSLGELEIELRHPDAADEALHKALDLALAAGAAQTAKQAAKDGKDAPAAASGPGPRQPAEPQPDAESDGDGDDDAAAPGAPSAADPMASPARLARIHLMLARSAQLRHDDAQSARWLEKIPAKDQDLPVLSLRAELLARGGQLAEARQLLQSAPADTDEAKRLKVLTEVQLLREQRQFKDARLVLEAANAAQPNDVDLLYEQAMIDERLDKLDEMERLLRQVITLQPDHAQAMNALGYSLADRRLRLDEALSLVKRAHELAPADPFIVDSLGWIEFRRGNLPEATRWLRQAYTARNDSEIAAHLGEALWAQGQHDEALRIFQEARSRDADNEVLRETMHRLRATP